MKNLRFFGWGEVFGKDSYSYCRFSASTESSSRDAPLRTRIKKISVGKRKITNFWYADDTTLFATDEEETTNPINCIKVVSEELCIRINIAKTKVMIIDQTGCLPECNALEGYEKVDSVIYLGSTIETCGGLLTEIQHRIALGKSAMTTLRNVTCTWKISKGTTMRLIHTRVFRYFYVWQ